MTTDNRNVADTYVHFGPGVPIPATADRATAVWRGEELTAGQPEDPGLTTRRRNQRWILPLTVFILVLAVVIYFLWGRDSADISVSGVAVNSSGSPLGCDGTERLTGVFDTNGGEGEITYRWVRSDGTSSDELKQAVRRGAHQVDVTLDWSFHGYGTLDASATLRVLSPGGAGASASFTYSCPSP